MRKDDCRYNHKDCFALSPHGHCMALSDTDFPGDCPFYKSDKQVKEEDEKRRTNNGYHREQI